MARTVCEASDFLIIYLSEQEVRLYDRSCPDHVERDMMCERNLHQGLKDSGVVIFYN